MAMKEVVKIMPWLECEEKEYYQHWNGHKI